MPTMAISAAAADAANNSLSALVDGGVGAGKVEIRSAPQPANVAAVATGTLLANHVLSDPSFAASSGGVMAANAITDDTNTVAGTAAWARVYDSAGNAICDWDVGVGAGFTVNIDTVTFITAGTSKINSISITHPL